MPKTIIERIADNNQWPEKETKSVQRILDGQLADNIREHWLYEVIGALYRHIEKLESDKATARKTFMAAIESYFDLKGGA